MREHLLHHLLEQSAQRYPDKMAVLFKGKSVTYSDLERLSSELASRLRQSGIQKGDRVGIMLSKSIESIVSLFGILKAGAVYVPIDHSAPVDRSAHIISQCGIDCLITSARDLITLLSGTNGRKPTIRKAIVVGKDCDQLNQLHIPAESLSLDMASDSSCSGIESVEMSDGSPAYILHTSGSTGNPKGVAISHLNALTFINMAAEFFDITPSDRFCNHAPLHFDLSVFDIFVAVKCGATIVLLPEMLSMFPVKLAEYIEKEKITIWNSVSSVLTMLADKGQLEQRNFDSLRIVHFSGDIMPVKYLRALRKCMRNATFYNIYGQTEANSSLYYPIQEIPDDDSWRIPIGKPFPNFEVFAMSEAREIISCAGEEGELYVCSSTVALGYWGSEGMTREKFVSDPRYPFIEKIVYRTGDLVRIDEDGNFEFVGRKDHMVKSRGYRVELGEIEAVLSGHPEIMTAVAVPIPDELIGNRIAVILVPVSEHTVNKEDVFGYCAKRLPKYMMPESVEFLEALPMTSSGKIDRKSIAAALTAPPASQRGEDGSLSSEVFCGESAPPQ